MEEIKKKIEELKKEKNAIIVAHNYARPEVQNIADFTGDSLELSRKASETNAEMILFCGVHFMAETASIISPEAKVLLPDLNAGCSLAESITAEDLVNWKRQHPNAVVISYINTTAEVKAESDYCCTSSNAVKVVESIPNDKEILFLPDKFLGAYVQEMTGRKIHIWNGSCHVHEKITETDFEEMKRKNPDAVFLIHPESSCTQNCVKKAARYSDDSIRFFSTSGMINYVNNSNENKFVVATEVGILHRLKKDNPGKMFIPIKENAVCEYMKLTTLEKIYYALLYEQYEVKVKKNIADRARKAIENMISIG